MLKKYLRNTLRLLFLLSMGVGIQVSAPGCDKDEEPKGPDASTIGTIYDPTNDYQVVAVITGLGFWGCAQVTVEDGAGNLVTDATVEVNNLALVYDGAVDAYTDEAESVQLDYDEGEIYELTVTVDNQIIAEGIAQMPTTPAITAPADSGTHQLGKALTVGINEIKHATSVRVVLETPHIDADGNWINDTSYSFAVSAGQREVIIPAWAFEATGWYEISVEAVSGVSSSFPYEGLTDYDMGYNIDGPSGIFIAQAAGDFRSLFIPGSGDQTAPPGSLRRKVTGPQPATWWKRQWERWRRQYPHLSGRGSGSASR